MTERRMAFQRSRTLARACRGGVRLCCVALLLAVPSAAASARSISILKAFPGNAADGRYAFASLVSDGAGNLFGTTRGGGALDSGIVFTIKADGSGFAVLHVFTGSSADGSQPSASLILGEAGNIFGTTETGGTWDRGTVFTLKADGSGFALLHSFAGGASDGRFPVASLLLDGAGNLFGTTRLGGLWDDGSVFRLKTDGTGFTLLHVFSEWIPDGYNPWASLILDGAGNLYGTTAWGGASGNGTVFTLKTDGSGFAVLHSFAGDTTPGSEPMSSLVMDGAGTLYGTTLYGGASYFGTVFTLKTDGGGFAVLHSFAGGAEDGSQPYASLLLDGTGTVYGTTCGGGASDLGTVFTLKVDGSGFAVLHSFTGSPADGSQPYTSLLLDGTGRLYGTTVAGGASDLGTVFTVQTDGGAFGVLRSFTGWPPDGASPTASLILDGAGGLYGTTRGGGASDLGTVFTLKTDGSGFAVLHAFAGGAADGNDPTAAVLLDGAGNLYGTTYRGGISDLGTVFTLKTDGSGFAVLHSFAGGATDGASPNASLILDGAGNLYGTTAHGGVLDRGTVFTLKPNGSEFAVLHAFTGGATDGASPGAALVLDDAGSLYGTTASGGSAQDLGTVFTLKTDGSSFALLHVFGSSAYARNPAAALVLDGAGKLYGTTVRGGASNEGTVFTLETDGSGFAVLHEFSRVPWDGALPYASLFLDGRGRLYGTTSRGGDWGRGTVFALKTDGRQYDLLHDFDGGPEDGLNPWASLVADSSGNLYGTTYRGGGSDLGTVFSLPMLGPGGDANGDGSVDVSDVFYLIDYLFATGPRPVYPEVDATGDGLVDIEDVFYLINYLFAGGPAPV